MLEDHLALAERHVSEADGHVGRQLQRVLELERDGHDTQQARELLRQFSDLRALHIADRDRLRAELSRSGENKHRNRR
jgi:hypothetical protein